MARLIHKFFQTKTDFLTLRVCNSVFPRENLKKLCVLDSSFNPPHLGHYTLVKESINFSKGKISKDELAVLLLLSINNADKSSPQPAPFEDRVEMMVRMGNFIKKNLQVDVIIGLTDKARFVDKKSSIINYIKCRLKKESVTELSFLVGYDTLIRILNPKYYLPVSLCTALEDFFIGLDLFCLSRDSPEESIQDQIHFIRKIANGEIEGVPEVWASKIHLVANESTETSSISSSTVRNMINRGSNLLNLLIPEVANYILTNHPYN